ncbi:putative Ig domain-containing protein [Mitsuaria sp. 7]|uniref:putative Ig domain-containing protein n=1 Tax=Mitsuaria sp. 7 TaxID=1658665 RepID=UPI0007DCEA7B|nr:putative Ig domain-containing protein [Mitsuaria sp. 7]ANH67113.1 hypothetical protein ABE85_05190 [Mitsuaria sp. 7]
MGTRSFFQSLRRRGSVDEWADDAPGSDRTNTPCRHCARVRWFVGGTLLAAALLVLHAGAQSPSRPPASAPASKPTAASASASVAASAASDATIYVATPRALPPRPEEPIASAALPATMSSASAASAASAAGRDPMWLVYQTIPLPTGRLDRPYKARDLVRGGKPPYRITIDGALPPGMFVEEDGALAGTPTKTGSFRFLLTATDASRTRNLEQALYEIRVIDPKPVAAAAPAVAASVPTGRSPTSAKARKPDALKTITEDQTSFTVPDDPPPPMTYVLTQEKLDAIFKNAEASAGESLMTAAAAGEAAAEGETPGPKALAVKPPVMGPTLDQLREMLMPLKDVEHPTRAVFQDSLRARQCVYFLRHVNEVALEQNKAAIERCPRMDDLAVRDRAPIPGHAAAPTPVQDKGSGSAKLPPGTLPVNVFLDMLMPATLREEITDAAGEEHPVSQAKALNLTADGCGCSLPAIENDVYAFLPYWMHGEGDAPIPVRFDKFTRMQYMGALLRSNGEYLLPTGYESPGGGFARRVDQHGVGLDLVLYRRDFHVLMRLEGEARERMFQATEARLGELLDLRHRDLQGDLEMLLPPGWREAAYVYGGMTVFFEPTDREAAAPEFERFYLEYVQRLVAVMQKRPSRAFNLNLVIPQHLVGETATAFRFRNLLAIMKSAEHQRGTADLGDHKERGAATGSYKSTPDYVGTTDVTVRFLTPLGLATDVNKMQLRNRTDFNDELTGTDRMAVVGSIMPVLVYPGGKKLDLPPASLDALDRDLVYVGWSFGGVAFWPVPVASIGAGESVLGKLDDRFWSFLDQDTRFCKIVCPMRMPLRLALEALLLIVGTTMLLYGWNCRVRRMGHVILVVLWAGALITLAVASAIFSCDPVLEQLRTGNTLLVVIMIVLIVGGLIVTFKPRVEAP